jgi:hypothetical protein
MGSGARTCGSFGTFTRRSASKKPMRRISLLGVVVLALVAAGCLGSGSSKTVPTSASLTAPVPINLTVGVKVTTMGEVRVSKTYRISCPPSSSGDTVSGVTCSQLTGHLQGRYLADVRPDFLSAGPEQGVVRVRGTVDGHPVNRLYALGQKEFRNWMSLLGRAPSGVAPKHGYAQPLRAQETSVAGT